MRNSPSSNCGKCSVNQEAKNSLPDNLRESFEKALAKGTRGCFSHRPTPSCPSLASRCSPILPKNSKPNRGYSDANKGRGVPVKGLVIGDPTPVCPGHYQQEGGEELRKPKKGLHGAGAMILRVASINERMPHLFTCRVFFRNRVSLWTTQVVPLPLTTELLFQRFGAGITVPHSQHTERTVAVRRIAWDEPRECMQSGVGLVRA